MVNSVNIYFIALDISLADAIYSKCDKESDTIQYYLQDLSKLNIMIDVKLLNQSGRESPAMQYIDFLNKIGGKSKIEFS